MKLPLITAALLTCQSTLASTVIITVTGTVASCDADRFYAEAPVKVGDAWTLRATYSYPRPPVTSDLGIYNYRPPGELEFEVNGLFWHGIPSYGMSAHVQIGWTQVGLSASQTVPTAISPPGRDSSTIVRFTGDGNMITDLTSLPDSFEKWNLPAATEFSLAVGNRYGTGIDGWNILADRFDTISIQVIPEPSSPSLTIAAAVLALRHRRRVWA